MASQHLAIPVDTDVEVRVRSRGVDVRAELLGADGSRIARADAPNDRLGIVTLYLPAGAGRAVELRLIGQDHAANHGRVSVQAQGLPVRNRADRTRLAAVRAEAAACAAVADEGRGKDAAQHFAEAARLRRRIDDAPGAARNLLQEAAARLDFADDGSGSREAARAAAPLLADAGEVELHVRTLRIEGAALHLGAQKLAGSERDAAYERARVRLTEAADLALRHDLPYEAAYAFNYRGVAHHYQGRSREAQADYERALALFEAAGHAPGRSLSIDSLALLHHEQGEYRAATARFDEALSLTSATESPVGYAYTLYNSALPLRVLGQFDEAIARYQRAGELLREQGDSASEARMLHGIGLALRHAGEPERAGVLLLEALQRQEAAGNTRDVFTALVALADIDREARRLADAASRLEQARGLAGAADESALVLLGLANVDLARDRPGAARIHLESVIALDLGPEHPYRGRAWLGLGAVAAAMRDDAKATASFAEALRIAVRNASELEQAEVLARRAAFRLAQDEVVTALEDSGRAIGILETAGATGSHGHRRATFLATRRRAFELHIAGLLAMATRAERAGQGNEATAARLDALAASERSRMGGLLDALGTRGSELPTEWHAERTRLLELISGKRERREVLLERADSDAAAIAALSRDVELLRAELHALEARSSAGDDAASRPGGSDWTIARTLERFPPTDLVAEYFLGDERRWLFVARAGEVRVHELTADGDLAAQVRTLIEQWRSPDGTSDRAPAAALRATYPGPLAEAAPAARVWLVPDGALHAVPLAALPSLLDPTGWLARSEITVVPSLRAVSLAHARERPPGSPRKLAVVADPIFARDDPRVRGAPPVHVALRASTDEPSVRTRSATRIDALQRLPASAAEARAIASLWPAEHTLLLTGASATREAVLGPAVRQASYLHFATHGLADSQDPELSALVVSRYTADGRPIDGTLRLYELAGLDLAADVVVLSACETALGREIRGEGLVGLSHGFLQAGARTVVASLWPVADAATAALMREFYRHLLVEQRSPATALRQAQAHVRAQPRWRAPYYWAGFQVVTLDPAFRR